MKEKFYDTAFRKKIYFSWEDFQKDVDLWMKYYDEERPHSVKYCYGKTSKQTFWDTKHIALEKNNERMYINRLSDSHNLTDIPIM